MNSVAKFVQKLLRWRHRHFVAAGNPFRERRLRFFIEALVREGERILDVGYGYGQFENQLVEFGVQNQVIALDIVPRDVSKHSNVTAFVVANAAHLPFTERSIDVVYCNSLLEHVGDKHIQRQVFAEIERVGRKFFVQTPNRHFPIKPHHLLPFFQYWPRPVQRWVGQNILGHYEEVWLMDRKAMKELANIGRGIVIWEEKVMGLTKSFTLYRKHLPDQSE
jgi:ubiquinone/menaquinone biosynthesis C-methylase UbiE